MNLTSASAQILRLLPREGITRIMGHLADVRWPRPLERAVLGAYCRAYEVSLEECESPDRWTSFDHFFTRKLRPGARPISGVAEGPSSGSPGWGGRLVVSPADGRVESPGPVDQRSTFHVKGRPYRVEELVGDPVDARRYEGGGGCVIYLSPRDYHRVHAPVAGAITEVRSMPGDYYPVNAIGLRHVDNLFARNRRVAIVIDTPPEQGLGRVTVVMVAAMVVGRITVTGIDARDVPYGHHLASPGGASQVLRAPVQVAQGDEMGIFHLGSTAVIFLEPRAFERFVVVEGPVRVGEPLAEPKSLEKGSA